jgi:glycosyltransferase involved in cell wall biosynthesis
VIATKVGGLSEIVEDRRTGLLVPPGDAAKLAEAMREAMAARHELGRAAREHCAARFDLSRVAGQWWTLLNSLVSEREL